MTSAFARRSPAAVARLSRPTRSSIRSSPCALGTVFLNEAIGWSTLAAGAAIVVAVVLIVTARTPKNQVVGEVIEPLRAAA